MAAALGSLFRAATRLLFVLALLTGISQAQNAPNCPLWGPIYPTPTDVLTRSTAVPKAIESLKNNLDSALKNGTLSAANVSFHLSVFSSSETLFDFSYASPATKHSLTAGVLDKNTIFRLGSTSKFLTIYSLLAATGLEYFNDPITKWVPELAAAPFISNISTVEWQDVTIGALAGHMAGVKLFHMDDLYFVYNTSTAEALGLPDLPKSDIPTCGTFPSLRACSREEFFTQFQTLHPVTSAFNMPIYSNVAFQILAYALEGMTNQSFVDVFRSTLVDPLHLNGTYLTTPENKTGLNAIIPDDQTFAPWYLDPGDATYSADGLMFSNGADLAAIGQSILSSSLLPPPVTHQWLKPITHTPDLRLSIGMPWEILRTELPIASFDSSPSNATNSSSLSTRLVDLYTKNGGTGTYNTQFALSPDHGFGWSVLTAGPPPTNGPDQRMATMELVNELVVGALLSAFEHAALEQASTDYTGTYIAADNNSSSMRLSIVAGDGGLGLGVRNWTAGEIDLLKTYYAAMQEADAPATDEPTLRLYPVGLRDERQVALRGVFEDTRSSLSQYSGGSTFSTSETTPFEARCAAWVAVGEPQWGNVALDDFIFDLDETGMATAITARGARKTLRKQL